MNNLVKPILIAIILVSSASKVLAHTELVSTSPAADSIVLTQPKNISLTFSEPPILAGSYIQIEQSASKIDSKTKAIQKGNQLMIAWPTQIVPGLVTIKWRAVADDGHVSNGTFDFTYQQAVPSKTPNVTKPDSASRDIAVRVFAIAFIFLIVGIAITTRRKK